jgi:hypothetical protein
MSRLEQTSNHIWRNTNSYSRLGEVIIFKHNLRHSEWCALLGET